VSRPEINWPRPAGPLSLRPPTEADIDQVLTWRNRPDVTRWLLRTRVDPDEFRKHWLDSREDPDDHAVVADLDGVVVGTVSLEVGDAMGQIDRDDIWRGANGSLGYVIDPEFAGRGFATAMARAVIDLGFAELGLHRIMAGVFADNLASCRVLEKLGMRREEHGVKDSWHAELGWVDGYTYAILAEEWSISPR
jgi:RimJ/RimL family protein N-acetyltransferase